MIIKSMTASYGRLKNESLELKPGLNIISAPNESGKSTWCSFIKNMLYGVDSSAREKGGVKPDKIKFSPWSGQAMEGTMELTCALGELTLVRKGRESAPMRELSVTYTGTGRKAQGVAPVPGQTLLGVPRDVFERSAFISQGSIPIGANPELEKRIAAIVQTGDETSSCTDAVEELRAAMRRRRFNRSGRLPEIEREQAELRRRLAEMDEDRYTGQRLEKAREQAIARRDALTEQVAESRRERRKKSLDDLSDARSAVRQAELADKAAEDELSLRRAEADGDAFSGKEVENIRAQLTQDAERLDAAQRAASGKALKVSRALTVLFLILVIAAGIAAAQGLLPLQGAWKYALLALLSVLALVFAVRTAGALGRRKRAEAALKEFRDKYYCGSPDEAFARLDEYEDTEGRLRQAQEAREKARLRLDEATGRLELLEKNVFRELDFSGGGDGESQLTRQLEQAEAELRTIREQLSAWEGRRQALGTGEELEKKLAALDAEHRELTMQYEALSLAADTMKQAGEEIQSRMTPRLSARASELFSLLTGGSYDAVALDMQLRAEARPTGASVDRQAAFLSAGALDQLYLAVRLAICELALPEEEPCPLILDDALVCFDDRRCRLALELFRELAGSRQILLFTCHGREAEMMSPYGDVNIISEE